MEVHLSPETESRLQRLAATTGRTPAELIADATEGYLQALSETREMLDRRYDEIKSGKVKPIDGPSFFEKLRQREEELLNKPPAK
jgi:predicted DNA-binding protein